MFSTPADSLAHAALFVHQVRAHVPSDARVEALRDDLFGENRLVLLVVNDGLALDLSEIDAIIFPRARFATSESGSVSCNMFEMKTASRGAEGP